MSKQRKSYSNQCKSDAVKLITDQGYNASETAQSLGIHNGILRHWKKQLDSEPSDAFPENGKTSPEKAELMNLRKEVKRLKMERERLKKAAAFFAKESMQYTALSDSK
jgi:transposase